ncbi:MFS transporter [Phytoactinopolyspora halotolerans]|uniref:MFS transporter n=1 Tax=Phytoactinopolyspora halotolerans TaxID=1981512 RepID=A0A6L9S9B4_9ACTN|nr:MFS transporter [Phytoactinopolyspora halotolerans]NEE01098.1 MFS transporter [Phytoactinopolyspora halotolerans]
MSAITTTPPGVRAGPREWLGLAVLALPTILIALDLTVLYMALPQLGSDLGASNTQMLWITDIYGFVVAGLLVTMGTLGDRIGRRRLLLIGATAFGAMSVLAAYSTSAEMLTVARALLGLAGATLMPSTLSLIGTMFTAPKQRGLAIGIWGMSFSLGTAIGPAIGGAMLENFWWGSVFLLGVPVMVVLLATGPLLLPEYRAPHAGRLDLVSVMLSLGAILPVVYGIKEIAKDRAVDGIPAAAIAAAIIIGWLFVRRQSRLDDPLLDLRMFADRRFSGAVAGLFLAAITLTAVMLFFTQYLQLVEGLSPLRAGLWFLPMAVAFIVSSIVAPLLARRVRPARVIVGGLSVAVVGLVLLTQLGAVSGLAILVAGCTTFAFGVVPLLALGTDMVVSSAPPEKTGSAAATSETGSELGMAMGIATLGAAGTAVYSSELAGAMPAAVPADASATARDSFANAFAVADELPSPLGDELVGAAREAFTAGFNVVAAGSAVLLIGIAVLVVAVLRHVRPFGHENEPAGDLTRTTP